MKGDSSLRGEAKGASQRKCFAARKSAPVADPLTFNSIENDRDSSDESVSSDDRNSSDEDESDSSDDSDSSSNSDSSPDETPETMEESSGTRDPPTKQLLQESGMRRTVPVNDSVSETARSPPKAVHFSDDIVDMAHESANLLKTARSPRNASLQPSHATRQPPGKLKKPNTTASSLRRGKIDEPSPLFEPDRSRSRESSTCDIGGSPSLEGVDNRKRSTRSNQTAESEQSQVGPGRERLANGHTIQSSKVSSSDKWSKEDCLKVAVLRDANVSFPELHKYFPTRSVQAISSRARRDRKAKRLRISNKDRRRIVEEYHTWKSFQQKPVPAQSRKRSAEQEGSGPSTNIRPSKRLRTSGESEKRSKTTAAKLSPRAIRRMGREKRRREAEPEDQHSIHDDAEDDETLDMIVIDQRQDDPPSDPAFDPSPDPAFDPPFDPEINPNTIVRTPQRAKVVVVSRQSKRSSRPPSIAISSPHRHQVTQTAEDPRISMRDTNERNEESDTEPEEEDEPEEQDEPQEEDEGQQEDSDAPTVRRNEPDRLWGHQAALDKIFSYVEEYRDVREKFYNDRYRRKTELKAIKKICDLCRDTASKYKHLRTASSSGGLFVADETPVEQSLPVIIELVEDLDPDDEGNDDNDHSIAATQVYLYVFPALARLLQAAMEYHCSIIPSDDPRAMLNVPGLDSLDKIFALIETLDRRSKSWKAKPEVSCKVPVVKDMRNNVTAKMYKIAQDLRKRAAKLRISAIELHEQKLQAEAARRQRELEQRQEAERLAMKEKAARLGNLYFERLKLEPDIHRQSKLRTPKFGHRRPELDANGERFERVSMFQERTSNHIPHEWEDGEPEWQDDEKLAIIHGLQTYYGSKRFWIRMFQKNCGSNGALRDRKVHEILRQTKFMRDIWMQADREEGRVTEDYIVHIPDLDLLELL